MVKVCRLGLHKWEPHPISKGQSKRGVTDCRQCRSCGCTQIRKAYYPRWVDIPVLASQGTAKVDRVCWAVKTSSGELYDASNANKRVDAKMHHESYTGTSWKKCYAEGDRLVKVRIQEIQ